MNEQKQPVTKDIQENEAAIRQMFSNCDDLKIRKLKLGAENKVECLVCYIEVNIGNAMFMAFGQMVSYLEKLSKEEIDQAMQDNVYGLSDAAPFTTIEDAALGILIGDAILFVDGYAGALKIPDKGYPNMGVGESDTEKVVRGSNESFTESEKANTALIRKRFRSTRLKVKEFKVGHPAIFLPIQANFQTFLTAKLSIKK